MKTNKKIDWCGYDVLITSYPLPPRFIGENRVKIESILHGNRMFYRDYSLSDQVLHIRNIHPEKKYAILYPIMEYLNGINHTKFIIQVLKRGKHKVGRSVANQMAVEQKLDPGFFKKPTRPLN